MCVWTQKKDKSRIVHVDTKHIHTPPGVIFSCESSIYIYLYILFLSS